MSFVLKCTDCGVPVGTIKDKNVPARCRACQDKLR